MALIGSPLSILRRSMTCSLKRARVKRDRQVPFFPYFLTIAANQQQVIKGSRHQLISRCCTAFAAKSYLIDTIVKELQSSFVPQGCRTLIQFHPVQRGEHEHRIVSGLLHLQKNSNNKDFSRHGTLPACIRPRRVLEGKRAMLTRSIALENV